MKAGKTAPRNDSRTLNLSNYAQGLPIPPRFDWAQPVHAYGMLGNDRIGDCTCVAAHQMVQTWSANTDTKDYRPVARDVILTYSRLTGYNRRTGEHDDGANMLDVLKWWRRHGLSTGHMIDAFAAVDTDDVKESLPQAIYRFGGVYLGFALPEYVESKPRWHMADSPGGQAARAYGFGGHAVFGCAYDADGITVISWGRRTHVDWAFLHRYLDEAYACLDDFWINRDGRSPGGLDAAALRRDLLAVATPRLKERAN